MSHKAREREREKKRKEKGWVWRGRREGMRGRQGEREKGRLKRIGSESEKSLKLPKIMQ